MRSSESAVNLEEALISLNNKMKDLIINFDRAGMSTLIEGKTLTTLINERDLSIAISKAFYELVNELISGSVGFSQNDSSDLHRIDIEAIRKKADSYAKKAGDLDIKIRSLSRNIIP